MENNKKAIMMIAYSTGSNSAGAVKKLAPAEKNSTDVSAASAAFSISV